MAGAAKTRRRGAELEHALLDAAWEQLVSEGYSRFTFDTVADRAQTSKPVLYRRWPGRGELLRAAIRHRGASTTTVVPDTGNVRDDLIGALQNSNAAGNNVAALLTALVSSHFDEIGMTPAELRTELLGSRQTSVEQILARGVQRGEVDPAKLSPRIIDLPFTLFRHEYMMTFQPVPTSVLEEFIDMIVLPLIRADAILR